MAARLRDGLVAEGATVLDAGMVGTEMLYFLVGSRELDGGAMVTASHNPKAYTGVKLVREGALALSGDAGIGDVRAADRGGAAGAAGRRRASRPSTSTTTSTATRSAFIDPERVKPLRVVVDGGNGMAGPMVGPLLERLGLDLVDDLLGPRRRVPRPRAEPAAAREPPVHHRPGARRGRRPRDRLGRRRRPLLLHRRQRRVRRRRLPHRAARPAGARASSPAPAILYDVRASRAVPDTVRELRRHLVRQPRRPRVLQARRCASTTPPSAARSPATTTSATSGARTRARSRRCSCSSCSRSRAAPLSELVGAFRERYFISGEINSEVADQEAKMKEIAERHSDAEVSLARRRLGRLPRLALQRPPVEHRAASAPQPRVARLARGHGAEARRGAGTDPFVTPEEALDRARARPGSSRLRIPTPFAVGRVNCYLIEDEPLTLVDTGPELGQVARRARAPARRARARDRGDRAGRPHPPAHRPPRPGRDRRLALGRRGRGDRRRRAVHRELRRRHRARRRVRRRR